MRLLIYLIIPLTLLVNLPAYPADIISLADCTMKIFKEINKTHKWSGKAPVGCAARIAVENRHAGVFVTAWSIESAEEGWVRTSFSSAMAYAEIAQNKSLAKANKDIMSRAKRLERCLNSINTVNDPLECRDEANKSYLVGEASGIENKRLIWLDDNGRHTVAEYSFGNTSATPAPPVDLFGGQPLPPGMILDLHLIR
jgi:hypothetical protein